MRTIVWGLAAGWGSTRDAARGALTTRTYEADGYPEHDWLRVLSVETREEENVYAPQTD